MVIMKQQTANKSSVKGRGGARRAGVGVGMGVIVEVGATVAVTCATSGAPLTGTKVGTKVRVGWIVGSAETERGGAPRAWPAQPVSAWPVPGQIAAPRPAA